MRLALKKGKCWIELCSCLNIPGKARQERDPAWWSQLKHVVSPEEHIAAQTQLSHGELGPCWKVVALGHLMMLSTLCQPRNRLLQAEAGNLPNTNHLSSVLNLCWHWILFSGLNWSGYTFFVPWKDSIIFFLPVCFSRNGAKNLSRLTQIVIKRELVIVPDLEDKLRWNLIFCLVQAPEVLLKSDRERNQGKIKGLLVKVGRAWLLSSHSSRNPVT